MLSISETINALIGSKQFLLIAELISFFCKSFLLVKLASTCSWSSSQSSLQRKLSLLLIIFLSGAILNDINFICLAIQHIFISTEEFKFITFIARIGWAFFLTQHQALSLFLEQLIEKKTKFNKFHIPFFIINLAISFCFIFLAFFKYNVPSYSIETLSFEIKCVQACYILLFPLFIPVLYKIYKKIRSGTLPKIITHQLKVFICFLILPHLFFEHITNPNSLFSFAIKILPFNKLALLSISTILCGYAIYYCCKRIMNLRFLNSTAHVESKQNINFIKNFRGILEQLTYVTAVKELMHITQAFFNTSLSIPLGKTKLYIRSNEIVDVETNLQENINIKNKVENFIAIHTGENSLINTMLQQTQIFIKDEIEFTNFYKEQEDQNIILDFLNQINADIFLPIYKNQTILAYIIIEKDARANKLFNSSERDEMLVFTSYLCNIINILKHSNLQMMLQNEKELKEELYFKHQEINQYKESIRSFLRNHNERKIGIIFYKARKFSMANEAAQELIAIDLNANQGHPSTILLKQIVKRAQEYKTSQTSFIKDVNANKLMICAIPSSEPNSVIIMLYYPEISDIIASRFNLLKDPSKWDYLLYLETTQSGRLINQLIPGISETLLNFKISLLETALTKKATLLQMAEADLLPTVEILHHISLRKNLHVLKLTVPEKNDEVAIALFGLNPIFETSKSQGNELLAKLDTIGTLFIENIHLLSLDTQNYLAEFITYGYYHKFKSDHKIFSNVKIIASSTKNLSNLANEGLFSKSLFNELKKTTVTMPLLSTLPETEIKELTSGYTEQIIKSATYKKLLELNDRDNAKLLDQRPMSLYELKNKVHQLLVQKSTKQNIHETTEFDVAYYISDPELAAAIRLGKKALKDPNVMQMLWDKFKNQNKIATLLGVNRSSVNRRCQEYKLIE